MKWVLFSFIDEKKEPQRTSSRSQVKIGRTRSRALPVLSVRVGAIRGPAAVTRGDLEGQPPAGFLRKQERWTDVLLEFHAIRDDRSVDTSDWAE